MNYVNWRKRFRILFLYASLHFLMRNAIHRPHDENVIVPPDVVKMRITCPKKSLVPCKLAMNVCVLHVSLSMYTCE